MHEIGGHRQEDEDSEVARGGFGPNLAQAVDKPGVTAFARGSLDAALDPPDGQGGQDQSANANDTNDLEKELRGIRIKERANGSGGDGDTRDHHQPCDGGGRRAAARRGGRGEQSEKRGARGTDAHANQCIGQDRQGQARRKSGLEEDNAMRRAIGPKGQRRHAADDPAGAMPPRIRQKAPVWARDLNTVVQRDKGTGQDGRQGQFYHHQSVEG